MQQDRIIFVNTDPYTPELAPDLSSPIVLKIKCLGFLFFLNPLQEILILYAFVTAFLKNV